MVVSTNRKRNNAKWKYRNFFLNMREKKNLSYLRAIDTD